MYSYFNPLENILQYLASLNPNVDLLIHLKLDEVTYFKTPNHFKLIKSYLHDLENKYTNTNRNLQFIFEMVDSQQHMGIQLADMLAGAYRKEEQYEVSGEKMKLIPFDYHLQISNHNLEHDSDFLKMYGLLSFSQVLNSVAQKNAIKAQSNHVEKAYISGNLKHVASSNMPVEPNTQTKIHPLQHLDMLVQKHRFNKNLKKTRRSLTTCLTNNSDTEFRQKTTPYLVSLSKAILENVENTNGQFAKVKQKDNPTTHQKNIVVLFNNLNKLTNLELEADSIYLINQALKRFNHRIPN